jgi:hypothetical protein
MNRFSSKFHYLPGPTKISLAKDRTGINSPHQGQLGLDMAALGLDWEGHS